MLSEKTLFVHTHTIEHLGTYASGAGLVSQQRVLQDLRRGIEDVKALAALRKSGGASLASAFLFMLH